MKTAIVTGASGGIGGAIVERLCADGYTVFAQYNNSEDKINALIDRVSKNGGVGTVKKIKFDLSCAEEIKNATKTILTTFSHIDLLVNCAGVGLYKLASQTTEQEWKKIFSINIDGAHVLTSLVTDCMVSAKSGKIINVSSIWGNVGACMEVAYSASKSAMIGYTKALAKELAPSGITVNCVCPGVIDTPMNSRFSKAEIEELVNATPVGRLGKPNDVASLVKFLASPDADFITGQIITVDGGFTL